MPLLDRKCRRQLRQFTRMARRRYEKHRRRNLFAEPGPHEFVVVLDHLKAAYNVPKIFRSAEVFGAREVHLIGIGPFDPAPAKSGFKHVPARHHEGFDTCYRELRERGYTLFTLEAGCGERLDRGALPARCAFVFGHEEQGISFDRADYPGVECLAIPQFGRIESLNVSVAASVVMYEYVRQYGGAP